MKSTLLLAGLIVIAGSAFAQKLNFVNYSVEQGLVQSQAQQIIQDDYGMLWIATWGGISRFDGTTFINYYKKNGLSSQIVYCINHQKNKGIWIGSHNGLQLYDGQKFNQFQLKINNIDKPIISILTDANENVYILNASGTLYLFKNDSLTVANQFNAQKFTYLAKDKNGHVYGASTHGIYNLSGNFKMFLSNESIDDHIKINKFYFDNKNNLWIITNKGLYTKRNARYSLILSNNEIHSNFTSIAQDSKQQIWLGSTKGAYVIDTNGTIKHIGSESGLTDNTINDIMVDRENNLWFSTDAEGIFKLPPNVLESYDTYNGLSGKVVMGFAKDNNGAIWIGTLDGGLSKYENGNFKPIALPSKDVGAHKINALLDDSKDNLWIGTLGAGLWLKEKSGFKLISSKNDLSTKTIISISEDASGTLWVTTPTGVFYYLDGMLHKIKGIDDACFSIIEASKDVVLVGSTDGIFQITQKSNVSKIKFEGRDLGAVNCFLKMGNDILLGTEDNGIIIWNPISNTIKQCSSENGLPSDFIFSMHLLDSNTVLAGTGKGISTIRLQNKSDTFLINNFTTSFNPYGPECNLNAIQNIGNDKIWVGTTKGIYSFNANETVTAVTQPLIYLKSVSLFSKNMVENQIQDTLNFWSLIPKNLVLKNTQNHLTFDFNGVTFSQPNRLQYQYKLVGVDSGYSEPTNSTKVIYPNLAPGTYQFKAFALTAENLRSSNEINFSFVIENAYYQKNWFKILLVVLLISIGFLFQYIQSVLKRKRFESDHQIRLNEQKKILERTSEDLHDDLGNKITRITILSEVLERKLDKNDYENRKLISQISENAQALYMDTKDIIWSLTPGNDNLLSMVEKLKLIGHQFFEDTTIDFEADDIVETYNIIAIPLIINRNLNMIVKEAFANSLRHSGATKVSMQVNFSEENVLKIELTDNGSGINKVSDAKGNGLQNMQKRMERIGGNILFNKNSEKGLNIILTVKIPHKE